MGGSWSVPSCQDASDKRSYQFHLKVINVKLRRCHGAVYIVAANISKRANYRFAIQYRQAMMFPTKLYRQFPTWKSKKTPHPLKKQTFPLFPHGWDPPDIPPPGRLKVPGAWLCAYDWFSQMERCDGMTDVDVHEFPLIFHRFSVDFPHGEWVKTYMIFQYCGGWTLRNMD